MHEHFCNDMNLVFDNCMQYNLPDSDIYRISLECKATFERAYQNMVMAKFAS